MVRLRCTFPYVVSFMGLRSKIHISVCMCEVYCPGSRVVSIMPLVYLAQSVRCRSEVVISFILNLQKVFFFFNTVFLLVSSYYSALNRVHTIPNNISFIQFKKISKHFLGNKLY